MSDNHADLRLVLSLLGRTMARVSLVTLLSFTFLLSWTAATASAPKAASEMLGPVTDVVLSACVLVLSFWSLVPFLQIYAYRATTEPKQLTEDTA